MNLDILDFTSERPMASEIEHNPIFYSSRFGSLLARLSRNSKSLRKPVMSVVKLLSQMKMTKGTGRLHNGGA